ncbi:hypothetical protein [Flagellimonas sp.]|uniref:hypothetical protein n=1 Tax=Flagellimonas sp. TaxID=2058762 RepID=UPI003F4A848F
MFTLHPILDQMESLYKLPRDRRRFDIYLNMLQGEQKKDMLLPIAGYNPMGKENVLEKIQELKRLKAEVLMSETLQKINTEIDTKTFPDIQVVLNLADDVGGSWSDRCTVDYTSKFNIDPLVKRRFCTPYFWCSEAFTKEKIVSRTLEYAYRMLFWIDIGQPKALKDFVHQEVYIASKRRPKKDSISKENLKKAKEYFNQNCDSEKYSILFNFFYGDAASAALNYPSFGTYENQGFLFANHLSQNSESLGVNLGFSFE